MRHRPTHAEVVAVLTKAFKRAKHPDGPMGGNPHSVVGRYTWRHFLTDIQVGAPRAELLYEGVVAKPSIYLTTVRSLREGKTVVVKLEKDEWVHLYPAAPC